ncbi:MAG: hypothetical protein OEZ06_01265 [Myxococcales bacterium]|nr:hypothetical protein [Myxococcales bacterium]
MPRTKSPTPPIPTAITASVEPLPEYGARISREFQRLLDDGAILRCAGSAKNAPAGLLSRGYSPKHRIDLFGKRFYLSNLRQNPLLRFFVAYVLEPGPGNRPPLIHARIFYKDISLIWRSASHLIVSDHELWIGKGALTSFLDGHWERYHTRESTTDLPLEMQSALEECSRRVSRIRQDEAVLAQVLHNAPSHRIAPYRDFLAPRERAAENPKNLIHRGRSVARFQRADDPTSLHFAAGFEPDFSGGLLEESRSFSGSYGGELRRFRILSRNRKVQYLFFAGPRHVWIIPPQALTTELSSYGVRTVDVVIDDDMCIPGYEYHFLQYEDEPDSLHSQIPQGYAGEPNPSDPDRADASAWIEKMPVVRDFRRELLKNRRNRRRPSRRP